MVLSDELSTEIASLKQRLDEFEGDVSEGSDEEDEESRRDNKEFIVILKDICALVRKEQSSNNPQLPELVEAAQELLNQGINFAYGESDLFDFLPSWAHDNELGEPLVKDRGETAMPFLPQGAIPGLLKLLNSIKSPEGTIPKLVPDPWNESMKRHPKTSLLARFRPDLPTLTPTLANPLAMSVYDARCEITSMNTTSPIRLQLSQGGACLAMNAMGGYKNRSPVLSYFILGDEEWMLEDHFLEVGLADIAYQMALDESRRLIFLGDENRVKSYAWGAPGGDHYEKALPTHTLDSGRATGPIAVLPNGTVVRAGKGSAAVWSLEGLQTHGKGGDKVIGKEVDVEEDTWRDDPEDIEKSSGSQPTSELAFIDNPDLKPSHWAPLTQSPSSMLCTTSKAGDDETDYDCFLLDLEHGGKIATRFLGHGGVVSEFSVSASDPQMFLTACNDGWARLYDLRRPLPVITFDACGQHEFCDAVALAHPDGIPTVFTGTGKAEQIKVWDVRARTPVYELATGNNGVASLVWDAERSSLYAATESSYMDRLGNHHDYRRAKIPKRGNTSQPSESAAEDDDMDDEFEDVDDDEDDFDGDERCWPKGAMHNEDYFGYMFDAGEHRIYSYQFKEDPNPEMLPVYGDATMEESYW